MHWSVSGILNADGLEKYIRDVTDGREISDDEQIPAVIVLDSIRNAHDWCANTAKMNSWAKGELLAMQSISRPKKKKKGASSFLCTAEEIENFFEKHGLQSCRPQVPAQRDGWRCGYFSLKYIDEFLSLPSNFTFTQGDLKAHRFAGFSPTMFTPASVEVSSGNALQSYAVDANVTFN